MKWAKALYKTFQTFFGIVDLFILRLTLLFQAWRGGNWPYKKVSEKHKKVWIFINASGSTLKCGSRIFIFHSWFDEQIIDIVRHLNHTFWLYFHCNRKRPCINTPSNYFFNICIVWYPFPFDRNEDLPEAHKSVEGPFLFENILFDDNRNVRH